MASKHSLHIHERYIYVIVATYVHIYTSCMYKIHKVDTIYGTVQMPRRTNEFESETLLVNRLTSTRTRNHSMATLAVILECRHSSTCLRHCITLYSSVTLRQIYTLIKANR